MTQTALLAALALSQFVEQTVTVPAGRIEEPCFAMPAGARLEFGFASDVVLDFNLHYHVRDSDKRDEVVYPLRRNGVGTMSGNYQAETDQEYCLMWKNRQTVPAELRYHYRVYIEEGS